MNAEKAIKQDREFVAQVIRSLSTMSEEEKQIWIEHPRGLKKALRKALSIEEILKSCEEAPTIINLETPNWESYRDVLRKMDVDVCDSAGTAMSLSRCYVPQEGILEIKVLSVEEMGFQSGAKLKDILARGVEMGYELCPPELGPALRIQYQRQRIGEELLIGMKSIPDSHRQHGIFVVSCDHNGLHLILSAGGDGTLYDKNAPFVFVKPHK
jgi:hypothetical protein